MFPAYKGFLNRLALKVLAKPVDVPNFHLGVAPYEVLQNVERGRLARTMPNLQRDAVTGGVLIGQTYTGVPGWGSIIPNVAPGDIPYYGEFLGGE